MSIPVAPVGIANFAQNQWATDNNPWGYHGSFLSDPDAFGKKLIERALKAGEGTTVLLYNVEGEKYPHGCGLGYVGYPLAAQPWVRNWVKRFAADLAANNLRLGFLLRHFWVAEYDGQGVAVPGDPAGTIIEKIQRIKFWLGDLADVFDWVQWDDNRCPNSDGGEGGALVQADVESIQSLLPGGPIHISTEFSDLGYQYVEKCYPCRWGDANPDRPFRELVMPSDTPYKPGALLQAKRVREFRQGDIAAFPLWDSPVADAVLAAWKAAQSQR